MFILLNKKKYESLCLELLQFVLLILITPLPFIFTQPLIIYCYMSNLSRLNTSFTCHYVQAFTLLEGNGSKHPHFFQNKNYFTKTSPILFAKMACLIKNKSTQTMISRVMSCNSRFV